MSVVVRSARPEERQGVVTFLRDAEYGGEVLQSDRLVVALRERRLVGAFRLVREHGVLMLRGMRVHADLRRCGIGTRLLRALTALDEACHCVPYASLEGFYGGAGFTRLPSAETPAFLRARVKEYRSRGLDVIVMRREAHESGASERAPR